MARLNSFGYLEDKYAKLENETAEVGPLELRPARPVWGVCYGDHSD